ncbi:MAG TPA: acyl-CoA synthetase [Myxococcota bacterium]|nr:acyl-CoA synthetase [Myxococcota bacterium]
MLNLAAIHEAIAQRVPDRECIVFRDRRLTWRDVTERSRRLGSLLRARLGGPSTPRAQLANWESGQAHVALYLYNGNEYLESMLAAFKARAVPINVNYRYVEEELCYLFENSRARAVIYHACFAPVLARIRARLPGIELWIQVADESGEPLLPGALDYEAALASSPPDPPRDLSSDDLYMLYTGGTTGMPKGVMWRQEDIFRAALYARPVTSEEDVAKRAERGRHRALPAPPFMHGAAHWAAFTMWALGGTVVVQSDPRRLDPRDIWQTAERERITSMTIVGDAFARPLIDELRERRYDLASLEVIGSGGAILTAALKQELLEHLPQIRINDSLGSSESGGQALQVTQRGGPVTTGDFEIAAGSLVLREDLSGPVAPGSGEIGWLARRGVVPLGYYRDPEKTQRTFPVVDGVRYSVPGDRALLEADGKLRLLGRDSVTINTGGEKVFAEEVEHALKHHPGVLDAVVVGTPHARFGQQVTALVALRPGEARDEKALLAVARTHIAAYKLPRRFVFLERIVRAPSGKADYRWARETASAAAD